jgi:pimeloyl-ACP methyl ester carboxylesterase
MEFAGGQRIADLNGVTLSSFGEGRPVFLVPGMEGSGESCLHLAIPVVQALSKDGLPHRLILVNYAAEEHETLEELTTTVRALMREAARNERCIIWGQSFGNLVAAQAGSRTGVDPVKFVFVSPFFSLPAVRLLLGTLSMRMTPEPVLRATIAPLGRYIFGPTGDNGDHPFFDALRRTAPAHMRRRTSWLESRLFTGAFTGLPAPTKIWFGRRDRLIARTEQMNFFTTLCRQREGYELSIVERSGHVVLPTIAVHRVRQELQTWLTAQTGP